MIYDVSQKRSSVKLFHIDFQVKSLVPWPRLCPHATSPQKHCGFQRAYLCAARPFPPLPLRALAVDSVHLDRARHFCRRPHLPPIVSLPLFLLLASSSFRETRRFPYRREFYALRLFLGPTWPPWRTTGFSLFHARRRHSVKFAFPILFLSLFLLLPLLLLRTMMIFLEATVRFKV